MKQVAILFLLFVPGCALPIDIDFGRFTNTVKVEWLRGEEGERRMRLLEDFGYIDPKGKVWLAPQGSKTDGASIPRVLWTLVGAPFEGQYREAAVIHDVYCESKSEPYQDVHRIFYYANRAAGVSEFKSKVLYGGVVAGGPKWGKGPSNCFAGCHSSTSVPAQVSAAPTLSEPDARKLAAWIEQQNPSLDEIDKYVQQNLRANMPAH